MIKVSIMYPNTPGLQFDHDYYRDKHLPLIQRRLGAGLKYCTIDKGLTGETIVPFRRVFNGTYLPSTAANHAPARIARHRGVRRHASSHLEG